MAEIAITGLQALLVSAHAIVNRHIRRARIRGESYNAESNHFCDAQFWPEPTREWFPVFDRIVVARGGTPRGRIQMNFAIRLPGAPEQTGKIWLGGFVVEEAD